MPRLTAIVPLLCLALSGIQTVKSCGRNRKAECVPRHLCNIGFEDEGPVVDLQVTLRSGNDGCESTEKCCPKDKIEDEHNTWMNPPENNGCGQVNKKGLTFTLSSANGFAQENELPWMVALQQRDETYLGGGSLIALDVVLTAHHTTKNLRSNEIMVRAGEWDFSTETETFRHVNVGVRKIVRHPLFNMRTGANNLALVFLEKPLVASRHIRPICLPSKNQSFDGKRCIVSGWGKDAVAQKQFMNIMKKVDLPVVSHRTCEAQLKKRKGPAFRLHDSMMCAGGEKGKDACMGDGGSPLACPLDNDPDRFEQVGIVNWGSGCGEANIPGVYTDVAKFRGWIDEQIEKHSIDDDLILDDDETTTTTIRPPRRRPSEEYNTPTKRYRTTTTGEDYEEYEAPTTPRDRPRPTIATSPAKTATYSPEEINPEEFFTVPTTMRYQETEVPKMKIVKT